MRNLALFAGLAGIALCGAAAQASEGTDGGPGAKLLLRFPTLSQTQIVFNYGGDLWIVSREGGDARPLTTGVGTETLPHFSPDGSLVAFTGEYDGNLDAYVVPATGGVPKRLTFHPSPELVRGWTPDGKNVTFTMDGNSFRRRENQLYTVPLGGGFPTQVPLPIVEDAAYSPDGAHLAYLPFGQWQAAWKRYRGGQTTPIWLADLKDSSITRVPRENSNDHHPMWVGDSVYFLSDRNGPVSLFVYDTKSGQVAEALHSDGFDFKTASAGPGAIVIEQFGAIKLYDLATHQAKNVSIRVSGDLAAVRPHFTRVEPKSIQNFAVSPTGARAVFEAWGEIFTVPSDKGDTRNVTRSPAIADRNPAWSPDGKSIAYFSDASGEYQLYVRDQNGLAEPKHYALGDKPSFFYDPVWSPDSKKIVYADKGVGFWLLDLQTGRNKRIDEDYFAGFSKATFFPSWSPDSQWVAYNKILKSGQHAVYVYNVAQGKASQITDGMSDAVFPVFDRNGKWLYFTASTDVALTAQSLDMSSNAHRVSRSVYVVVLSKDEPSPLVPESDEEKQQKDAAVVGLAFADDEPASKEEKAQDARGEDKGAKKEKDAKGKPVVTRIDLEGIGQRILSLPVPPRNYTSLQAGKSGVLFLAEGPEVLDTDGDGNIDQTVQKFDLGKRKVDKFIEDVNDFVVTFNGEKLLYRKGDRWLMASTAERPGGEPKPGFGPLKTGDWQVFVDPRAMWKQIYDETWRIERDFFYDPGYHGLDLARAKKKYEPYLANIGSRDELTYLFTEALGELTVGHLFVGGGEKPEAKKVKGGLLGADYTLENGRYRIARVFSGENWNPDLQAPLTQPGVNVKIGDYILGVNSRELRATDNIYSFFEGTAGKQVVLRVGPRPDGTGARDVTVVPVDKEENLRHFAWIEDNRRKVDQASGGRIAYVYVPNTGNGGFTSFNRYFFSQIGKEGVIIDERYNEGGQLADYIIDYLRRPIMSRVVNRDGADWSSPSQAIYGPKVMLINQMAGSGGDALPWYFRKANLGPVIGKRTWGGLVGISGYPTLLDGGIVTAPRGAVYGLSGDWEVENRGVPPDIDVDLEPQAYRAGRDTQLEKGIEVVMQQLKDHPLPTYPRPQFPNYHEHDDLGTKQ
jgi:tricorn protease